MRIIASWSGSHGPPNTSTRARSVALAGELPSVSTPCRPRPATADPTQNRWPLRSLDRDEDMVVLQTNNEIKYPNRRLDRNHPIQEWNRRPGASPSMRIIASWSGSHRPPPTRPSSDLVALAGELPSVSTPCRPRPATADPTQNRWPLRSLDRDE